MNDVWKPIIDACHAAVDKYGADNQVKKAIEELAELQVIDACRAAVDKYGADSQVKKAIEELAELQVELCHYLCGRGELGAISEEMADVKIMLEQLLIIFGNNNFVAEWQNIKAARLMERINADNKNSD